MTIETVLTEWVAMMATGASAEATAFRAAVPDLYPQPAPAEADTPFATWLMVSNARDLGAVSGASDCMIDSLTIQVDVWDVDPSPLQVVEARDLLFALLEANKPASAHIQLYRGELLLPEPEVGYHLAMTYEYMIGAE